MKRETKYANADGSRHGRMMCQACNKKITRGLYIYQEVYHHCKFQGYFNHYHRVCSENHKVWKKVDAETEKEKSETEARLEAFKKFAEEWGIDSLDEDIEWMESILT